MRVASRASRQPACVVRSHRPLLGRGARHVLVAKEAHLPVSAARARAAAVLERCALKPGAVEVVPRDAQRAGRHDGASAAAACNMVAPPWRAARLALQNDERSMSHALYCTRRRPARRRWPAGGGTGRRARAKRRGRVSSRAAPRGGGTCARGGRSGQSVAHSVPLSELINHPPTCVDAMSLLGTTGWLIRYCELTTL